MVPAKLVPQSEQGMCFAFVRSSCSSDICAFLCMHVCKCMLIQCLASLMSFIITGN